MTGRGTSPPPDGPLTGIGLALLGVAVAAGAVVWAGAQLAARITTGAWLDLPPAVMGGVLLRLAANPADPTAAFPAHLASRLPSAAALWASIAAAVSLPVTLLITALALRARLSGHNHSRDGEAGDGARMGRSRSDLGELVAARRRAQPPTAPARGEARIVLGHAGRTRVAVPARHSLLVLGPTQSGKTSRLAIPNLNAWPGPVIATSVKTDLLADTITTRREHGPVWIYDPADATRRSHGPRAGYDPLEPAATWAGALSLAQTLVDAADTTGLGDANFWTQTAAKLLAPLLHAAAVNAATIRTVVRWVDTQDLDEPAAWLTAAEADPEALQALEATRRRDDRTRSSAYATAETLLRAFADPVVAATTDHPDYAPEMLLDGAGTLYVCGPAHDQARLRPLFTLLITHTLHVAHTRATTAPLDPPLLVLLDEAANIAPLPDLDVLAATGAGNGIQLLTVFQDLAQIRARYGARADTITNNHRTKLILGGNTDPTTLDYASRLAGTTTTTRTTTSRSRGGTTVTDAPNTRPLLTPDALRRLPRGTGIVIHGDRPPVRVELGH